MNLTQVVTTAIAWTAVTGKPKWGSQANFFRGGDPNNGPYVDTGNAPATATFIEPTRYFGDSATVNLTDPKAIRLNVDWSKISGLASVIFHIVFAVTGGGTSSSLDGRIFDVTAGAAITGSTVTQANPANTTVYEKFSGDISANMPTANNTLAFQMSATFTIQPNVHGSLAEILVYTS